MHEHLRIDRAGTIHPVDGDSFERPYGAGGRLSHVIVDETQVFSAAPKLTVSRADAVRARLAELEAELAELRRFGSDDYEDGTVLTFKGDFGGARSYSYAAIKAGGRWHLTGGKAVQNATWDGLVEFLQKANVRKVRRVTDSQRVI